MDEEAELGPLDRAFAILREVQPDPADVERLAADTVQKRENPHDFASIFVRSFAPTGGWVICKLCGTYILEKQAVIELPEHPATLHVNWHNAQHRAGVAA